MERIKCFVVERFQESPELWKKVGTEEVWPTPYRFGPGAIFRDFETEEMADTGKYPSRRRGADGFAWMVLLPIGKGYGFEMDVQSTDNPRRFWDRIGSAPDFTLTPSIRIPDRSDGSDRWHGYLTNGYLQSC